MSGIKFTQELLEEISDYIQALDEQFGLEPDTVLDIEKAVSREIWKLRKSNDDGKLVIADQSTESGKSGNGGVFNFTNNAGF